MRHRSILGPGLLGLLLCVGPTSPTLAAPDTAPTTGLVVESQDDMAKVLARLVGKQVRLRLVGDGDEVVGRLTSVGASLAHVSELAGREYFDAAVRIDQIAAVSAQVRGGR